MTLSDRLSWVAIGALAGVGLGWVLRGGAEATAPAGDVAPAAQLSDEAGADPAGTDRRPGPMPGSLRPARAKAQLPEEPGIVEYLDLGLRMRAPRVVKLGEPFEVETTVANTGSFALSNVTVATRGHESVRTADDPQGPRGPETYARLDPRSSRRFASSFVATKTGEVRLSASAREERGWAAAGAFVTLVVVPLKAPPPSASDASSRTLDLHVDAELLDEVVVGQPFRVRLSIVNEGGLALSNVVFAWRGMGGVDLAQGERRETGYEVLPVGKRDAFVVRFVTPARSGEPLRVTASAREERGWCAAGAVLALGDPGSEGK